MTAPAALLRLHERLARRPAWLAVLVAGSAALLGLAASHARVESDMAALLPGGPDSPQEAARLLSEFGVLDTLLVELELPGAGPDQLVDAGADLARRLRETGRFRDVFEGPAPRDLARLGEVLLPHRLYLFDDPAAEIEARLAPERLAASLAAVKTRLASPQAVMMKKAILGDPLGLDGDLFARWGKAMASAEIYRGHLLAPDKAHLLVVTAPKDPALDVNASQATLDAVAGIAAALPAGPAGPARVRLVGGPRFAAESARAVRHDVLYTFVTSALGILAIFLVRFRSLRLIVVASIPLGLGVLAGAALVALARGRIHGLTLGFGSALIGIAIDYPTHVLNRADAEPGSRADAGAAAVRDVWESLWLGMLTTVLAFAALLASRFPGLRELALFAGTGVVAAFAATLLFVPPLYARLGPAPRGVGAAWAPRLARLALPPGAAGAVTAVTILVAALLIPRVGFDGDLRHLDVRRAETVADHDEVMGRYGQLGAGSLAVSRGANAESALAANDTTAGALQAAISRGQVVAVQGLGGILPSQATQRRRAEGLRRLDREALRARLETEADAAGFAAGAFDGFWKEVAEVASGAVRPLVPADFSGTPLALLVDRSLRCRSDGCAAISAFRSAGDGDARQVPLPADTRLVDGGALANETMGQIPRQLLLLTALGLLANIAALVPAYRSLRKALLATAPCVLGLGVTVAAFAAAGKPLDLVSASAIVLVLGCGVDYGIFVLQGLETDPAARPTRVETVGVLLASTTTLAGFGTLATADQPAMRSLGLVVGLGILLSAAAAIALLPGIHRLLFPGASR